MNIKSVFTQIGVTQLVIIHNEHNNFEGFLLRIIPDNKMHSHRHFVKEIQTITSQTYNCGFTQVNPCTEDKRVDI